MRTAIALAAALAFAAPAAAQRKGEIMAARSTEWAWPVLCTTGDGAYAWRSDMWIWKSYHMTDAWSGLQSWEAMHGKMYKPDPDDYGCVAVPGGTPAVILMTQPLMLAATLNGKTITGMIAPFDWVLK